MPRRAGERGAGEEQVAAAGELVFAYGVSDAAVVTGVDGPFAARETCEGNLTADTQAATATTLAATFTDDAANGWLARLATFK